jgi:hypothetical protein
MTETSVVIQIPQPLYYHLEQAAMRLQKPVERFLVETLQAALPAVDEIPVDIQAEISTLDKLDDVILREIARSEMSQEDQQTLEQLLDLQNMRFLTHEEATQLAMLRTEYGRVLLRKARAFALLKDF